MGQSRNIFLTAEARLPAKIRKFQCAFSKKNAKNLHFWAFWAKKAIFGRIFGEKAKTSLFYSFFFIFQYNKHALWRSLDFRPFFCQRNYENTDLNHQNIYFWGPLKGRQDSKKWPKSFLSNQNMFLGKIRGNKF